jgi:inner membrane protein
MEEKVPLSQSLKYNIYFKVGTIIVIALLLLIPTGMIESMIQERESTNKDAIREVSSKWGEEQTLVGPYLTVPYTRYIKEWSQKDSAYKAVPLTEYIHVLPKALSLSGTIDPEKRHRGIYDIVVYNSKVKIEGDFSKIDFKGLDVPLKNIHFDRAKFSIGINDLRGIEKQIALSWNDTSSSFNPGLTTKDIASSGINASIVLKPKEGLKNTFSFELDLKGSQKLYFTPVGKITDVSITSNWNNPSFNGAFLPDSSNITDTDFSANWNVLHLNRNYPQIWKGSAYGVKNSAFGIDLLLPVDNYQKSYRSIKYAILFIGFTFLVFFFIEVLNKVFIHPVQYILVGIALIVFYTLLLSVSEHLNYNLAFITSAIATLILIIGYVKAILKSNMLSFLVTGILTILYSFIFVIIQLQDYALLIGSIGIFMILGLVMYFSRKIDWYNLSLEQK